MFKVGNRYMNKKTHEMFIYKGYLDTKKFGKIGYAHVMYCEKYNQHFLKKALNPKEWMIIN